MPGISIGSVSVSVVPNLRGFTDKLKSTLLPQADALGEEIGARISAGVESALRDIGIKLNTSEVDAQIDEVGAKLDEVSGRNYTVNLGLDDARIVEALENISVKLDKLADHVYDVELELNAGNAVTRLDEISLKLDEIGGRDVTAKLGLDDSSFNRKIDEDMAKLDAAGSASAGGGFGGGGLIAGGILGAVAAAPALPGALTGAGASVASLGLAYEGISGALKDYTAAQNAAATATGSSARSASSAATQIRSAQVAVSNAETQAAHDAITSAEAVRNAQTQAAHDAVTSAESIRNAQAGVSQAVTQAAQNQVNAEQQLANAQYAEKQAQQALTDARQQAILTLQQLHDAEADTALGVEQAQLDLEQAKLNAQKTDASATATALQKAQADLAVREAQQRLKEATEARANAANAANKADKEGVSKMPAVVAAQHNLAQAHQSVADAQRNLVNVERQGAAAIAKAEQSLADAVRAASWQRAADAQRVSDASRNASWQQQADGQRVADAQYNLRTAYAAASAAAAGHPSSAADAAQKYAQALAALSPAGRQLVADILGIKNALKPLEGAAEKGIAPGFTVFANGIKALSPLLATEVRKMNTILGGFLASMGHAFQSSSFQATLKSLFAEGNQFIQIVTPALGQMVKAFLEMGAKSAPAVKGLGDGIAAIARGFGDLFKNLAPAAPAIGSVLRSLGEAVGAIGGPLGTVLGAVMTALAPLLSAALPALKALLGVTAQLVTGLLVPAFKAGLLPVLTAALHAVTLIISGGLRPLVATLTKDLAPVLPGIASLIGSLANDGLSVLGAAIKAVVPPLVLFTNDVLKALQPVLPQVEASLAQIGGIIAGVLGQAVKALAPVLAQTAQEFAQIFVALIPLLPPLLKLAGLLIDLAAKVITPLLPLIGDVATMLGGVDIAITDLIGWVVKIIAVILDWVANINHWKHAFGDAWNWVVSNVLDPMKTFFTSTVPGWWDTTIRFLGSKFVTPFKNAFKDAWTWVTSNVLTPMHNFFTNTIPGWFDSLANDIGKAWNKFERFVEKPVAWVVDNVFAPLAKIFDAITNALGLGKPIPIPHMAQGGKITTGTTGTADDVLARVSKGETVVSAEHSQVLSPLFAAVGVPGYYAGGVPVPPHGGPRPPGWHPGSGTQNPAGSLGGILGGIIDLGKILAAIASGNTAALTNAFRDLLGKGAAAGEIGKILLAMPKVIVGDAVKWLIGNGQSAAGGGSGGGSGGGGGVSGAGPTGGDAAANEALARKMFPWAASQWPSFVALEMSEAGFNRFARNPSSGAYGIPQALPPTKMPFAAQAGGGSHAGPQLAWMYNYIAHNGNFHDPVSAWAFHRTHNWYDNGGWMPPGLSLNVNGTGRPEPVFSPRQWDLLSSAVAGGDGTGLGGRHVARKLDQMIALLERAPARTAGGVGAALNGTARGAVHDGYYRTR